MRYLVSVINDAAGLASPTEMPAIHTVNARLRAEGRWAFAGGLESPTTATVISRGAEASFADRPFLESKEHLADRIIQAPDLEVALLAAEGSKHCNPKVEVRPFHGEQA
jgi:hypothetical protein